MRIALHTYIHTYFAFLFSSPLVPYPRPPFDETLLLETRLIDRTRTTRHSHTHSRGVSRKYSIFEPIQRSHKILSNRIIFGHTSFVPPYDTRSIERIHVTRVHDAFRFVDPSTYCYTIHMRITRCSPGNDGEQGGLVSKPCGATCD